MMNVCDFNYATDNWEREDTQTSDEIWVKVGEDDDKTRTTKHCPLEVDLNAAEDYLKCDTPWKFFLLDFYHFKLCEHIKKKNF